MHCKFAGWFADPYLVVITSETSQQACLGVTPLHQAHILRNFRTILLQQSSHSLLMSQGYLLINLCAALVDPIAVHLGPTDAIDTSFCHMACLYFVT